MAIPDSDFPSLSASDSATLSTSDSAAVSASNATSASIWKSDYPYPLVNPTFIGEINGEEYQLNGSAKASNFLLVDTNTLTIDLLERDCST